MVRVYLGRFALAQLWYKAEGHVHDEGWVVLLVGRRYWS